MEDLYKILGVHTSATPDEIRRAYRILARRYHPDVNPGRQSEDRFKLVASAYDTLSDPDKRTRYDASYEKVSQERMSASFKRYEEAAKRARMKEAATETTTESFTNTVSSAKTAHKDTRTDKKKNTLFSKMTRVSKGLFSRTGRKSKGKEETHDSSTKLSIIEVSISTKDAVFGVKKTIEIAEPEGTRKVSVRIPPGVRTGSVVRLRARTSRAEDLVLIVRVASHPFISIQPKGLVIEVPITVNEAIAGAHITVPTLDGQLIIKVAPGTQSGTEVRVKEKGIPNRDGTKGDLFYRLMVKVPDSPTAVGIKEKAGELELYYGGNVRQAFPKVLLEGAP